MRNGNGPTNLRGAAGWCLLVTAVLAVGAVSVEAITSPAQWYQQAPLDTDGNKLDDVLDQASPESLLDVFVCFRYDCIPADRVAQLEQLGTIGYTSTSVAAIQVYDISLADLQNEVATWPEVGFVCPNEEAVLFMGTAGEAIKAHAGHYSPNTCQDQGNDGTGVTIAIVDSGVEDLLHPDLPAAVGGLIMVDGQTGQYVLGNPSDDHGHGTMVAGCALGRGSGGVNRGTAPGASLFDARVSDASGVMTMASILAATDWLLMNWATVSPPIKVVNYSVGFDRESDGFNPLTQAVNQFRFRNITAVAGIGNHGTCDTTWWGAKAGVGHLAVANTVLTIGAASHQGTVDRSDDSPSGFSRVGPGIGLSPKPDVVAYGGQCTGACPDGCQSGSVTETVITTNRTGGYSGAVGTSFAAPQVAGLCACFLQAHSPRMPHPHALLRSTAQDIGPPGWDSATGHGLVDPAAIEGMGKPLPPVPSDLEVLYVNYAPQPVVCGQPTLINVTVRNVGAVPVDSFTVDFKRYYFGPNYAPVVLYDIGSGPEWNTAGPLLPGSTRTFLRWWTPGVSDSLPLSQHSCFWGIVDAVGDGWPQNDRRNINFTVSGLTASSCGPQPPSAMPTSGRAKEAGDNILEIPLAVSHDKPQPVGVDVIVENPDPDHWLIELETPEGLVGPIVNVLVAPEDCLVWVTLRAVRLLPHHEGPVEVLVVANSADYGVLGEAIVLIDPLLGEQCCNGNGLRGNVDGDPEDLVNISDMTYLVAFLFSGGAAPPCLEEGDVNADEVINISDMTYLVAYLFSGGPAPEPCP